MLKRTPKVLTPEQMEEIRTKDFFDMILPDTMTCTKSCAISRLTRYALPKAKKKASGVRLLPTS